MKVLAEWKLLFSEIENTIQGLKSRYSGEAMGKNTNSSAYEGIFLEVSSMLAQETNELKVSLVDSSSDQMGHTICPKYWSGQTGSSYKFF